jgi:CheY-like chemotaxis protein
MVGGWGVWEAKGGNECIIMAAEFHPDAILLDVMKPGMDGPTTAEEPGRYQVDSGHPAYRQGSKR